MIEFGKRGNPEKEREVFETMVADLEIFDEKNVEIPYVCRDCPWVSEAGKGLAEITRNNEQNMADYAKLYLPGTVEREKLERDASEIARTMAGKTDGAAAKIRGIVFEVLPDETSDDIIKRFFDSYDELIQGNNEMKEILRRSISEATGRCAGALVWDYVEGPDGGAVANLACYTENGALLGDEEDGGIRPVSGPRRFSPEEWEPYKQQIKKNKKKSKKGKKMTALSREDNS